jgi:hypothetical protein
MGMTIDVVTLPFPGTSNHQPLARLMVCGAMVVSVGPQRSLRQPSQDLHRSSPQHIHSLNSYACRQSCNL